MSLLNTISTRVKIFGISPEMVWADTRVLNVFNAYNYPAHTTSINDRKHSITSLHYSGNAIDYDLNAVDINEHLPIHDEIKAQLTDEFDVVYEQSQDDNNIWHYHIHVEFQPKRRS